MKAQGSLFIISAPSGTGKTSLVKALCQELPDIKKSISHTTREKREGEQDGMHYNFVSKAEFDEIIKSKAFLEHAKVFDNFYGTSKEWVQKTLNAGTDVILEIDWQGARQIRSQIPDAVSVFILPPSSLVLRQRLTDRRQDDPHKIAARLAEAEVEVSHYTEYEYLIVNDDFSQALKHLKEIILAARLRVSRQKAAQQDLILELLES